MVLTNAITSMKSESLYKSPPSSISDQSQLEGETPRGRRQERERSLTLKADDGSGGDEKEYEQSLSISGKPRKRKRSRKGLDKNFPCPSLGCGKSYSRAEHLYRHQLNRKSSSLVYQLHSKIKRGLDTPKKIYYCDHMGCDREFVRQDLCARHMERHTARGSHLQRKEPYLYTAGNRSALSSPVSGHQDPPEHLFHSSSAARPAPTSSIPRCNTVTLVMPLDGNSLLGRMGETQQLRPNSTAPQAKYTISPHSHSAPVHQDYNSAMVLNKSDRDELYYSNSGIREPEVSGAIGNTAISSFATSQRHHSFESVKSNPSQRPIISNPHTMTSPTNWRTSSTFTQPGPTSQMYTMQSQPQNNCENGSYTPLQNFPPMLPLPPPVFPSHTPASKMGYTGVSTPPAQVQIPTCLDIPVSDGTENTLVNEARSASAEPVFAGDGFNRSPFAMADDFAAWLFGDTPLNSSSSSGHRHNTMSLGDANSLESLSRLPYGVEDESFNGQFGQPMPPQHPMSVTSILDPGLPQTILSEEKRQQLLTLIVKRFYETDRSPVGKQKEKILDGDRDDPSHVLSLRMMKTYIGSYWYHFHPQMPILHKPTFSADNAQNLLLIAVIAIGASCLDKIHGLTVTRAGADLSKFLAWHLREEIFKDSDFIPPAKLWVFQALLLLEVYEKMYSTRLLHERAHVHHGTTLTLLRRGSSLIGRSGLDSPPVVKDESTVLTTSGGQQKPATNTPDQWWNHWIISEATRRVAFAAFIIDSIHATMFGHGATMVAHEMKLPLPCDESLWSATSSAEVGRIEQGLQASGVKPITFLTGLKSTLSGKTVRTNSFGRTALMAGLLSVSWHMNQRDVQVRAFGALTAVGGRDKWRSTLTKAFDFWRRDFDQSVGKDSDPAPTFYQPPGRLDEENIFESRTVLHHLAHMAMHVDIVSCQIFAKAGRLLGRTTLPSDFAVAQRRIKEHWAPRPSARDATFFSLKFLAQVLTPSGPSSQHSPSSIVRFGPAGYSARDDFLLNRPWVLYFAALIVWSYGYALDGVLTSPPDMTTLEQQTSDMRAFLGRVGGVEKPDDLENIRDRNACMGMLCILQDMFTKCRWELLHEAANLLGNCINMLKGSI